MFNGCGFPHAGISHNDEIAVGAVSAPAPGIHNHQAAAGILGKIVPLPIIETAACKRKSAYKGGDRNDSLQDALNLGIGGEGRGNVPEALFLQVGNHPHLALHNAHHAFRAAAYLLESLLILGDRHD